jgi:hypothetical protein
VKDESDTRFSDFKEALIFMQQKLNTLTEEATKHQRSKE